MARQVVIQVAVQALVAESANYETLTTQLTKSINDAIATGAGVLTAESAFVEIANVISAEVAPSVSEFEDERQGERKEEDLHS